jgi:cytochrome c oxidase assembly protein subunit 15
MQGSALATAPAYRTTEKPKSMTCRVALLLPPSEYVPVMASIFQAFPQLRTAAPRLSRRLFMSRPCLNSPIRSAVSASRCSSRPSVLQSVRWKSTQPLRSSATIEASHAGGAKLAEAAAKTEGKSSSFPKTTSKSVAYWLLGSAASVFGIVIFGGLTRLTESG